MGFPSSQDPPTRIRSKNSAELVGKLLKERHEGNFMIWNLSEETYDGTPFDNQVPCLPPPRRTRGWECRVFRLCIPLVGAGM